QNTARYPADPIQLYLQLARGEGDVTLWNMPDIALQRDENGYPFGYLIPASGTPVLVDATAIVEGAPEREAAEAFYEFVTSQDALIDQARRFHRIPARTDVPADSLPGWMTALDLRVMPLDWPRLAEDGPEWMQYWDENIRGRGAAYLQETGGSAAGRHLRACVGRRRPVRPILSPVIRCRPFSPWHSPAPWARSPATVWATLRSGWARTPFRGAPGP